MAKQLIKAVTNWRQTRNDDDGCADEDYDIYIIGRPTTFFDTDGKLITATIKDLEYIKATNQGEFSHVLVTTEEGYTLMCGNVNTLIFKEVPDNV